jgi:hypothetical protein
MIEFYQAAYRLLNTPHAQRVLKMASRENTIVEAVEEVRKQAQTLQAMITNVTNELTKDLTNMVYDSEGWSPLIESVPPADKSVADHSQLPVS